MSILGDRIKKERENLNMTREDLAKKIGVSYSAIAMYEQGNREPSNELILKMCEIFNCTLDYLVGQSDFKTLKEEIENYKDSFSSYGIKPELIDDVFFQNTDLSSEEKDVLSKLLTYTSDSFDSGEIKDIDIYTFLGDYPLTNEQKNKIIRNFIISLESQVKMFSQLSAISNKYSLEMLTEQKKHLENILNDLDGVYDPAYYLCPVYGRISAGQPNWAEENIEGHIPVPIMGEISDPENCFYLKVNGESMNLLVKNGAYALIHKQDIVDDGDVAVVLVNGYDATLKRFSKQGNFVVLEPMSSVKDDPEIKTQIYDKKTSIKILGKYIGKFELNK